MSIRPVKAFFLSLSLFAIALPASATIVQFQTSMGTFEVNLFDKDTPKTVENFLRYVEDEAYNNSFFHRSIKGFISQGGGYSHNREAGENAKVEVIPRRQAVDNEPVFSNQRGTIAMAKLGNNPNSATVEWFINLEDNSENLDNQNGGFTVFGQVINDGMDVIDAIAELEEINVLVTVERSSGNRERIQFSNFPVRDFDSDESTALTHHNLVMINAIEIIDWSEDTADDLEPMPTTRDPNAPPPSTPGSSSSGSANGTLLALLFLLGALRLGRKN